MYPLFETICVNDGVIQNREWHQKRFESSFFEFYERKPDFKLLENIEIPNEFSRGISKLRVRYGKSLRKVEFETYHPKKINSLQLVESNEIDYSLKYNERTPLNELFEMRGNCDDVLIIKNGMITDTSYANIVFYDGINWYTPTTPLLKGTCRQRLLEEGQIFEKEISIHDLGKFIGYKLINAMNDLHKKNSRKIENIVQ